MTDRFPTFLRKRFRFPPNPGIFSAALDPSHNSPSQPVPTPTTSSRRAEWLLFFACFFAFAYFNQGGGWNQNARFAEVRAIVEEGRFAIDDYLVYRRVPGGEELVRC